MAFRRWGGGRTWPFDGGEAAERGLSTVGQRSGRLGLAGLLVGDVGHRGVEEADDVVALHREADAVSAAADRDAAPDEVAVGDDRQPRWPSRTG